ncbi:hypothetical protein EWM64_g7656, partial [Hericium alpestre]
SHSTTTCSSIGDLPPTTQDCQTIIDAVEILEGKTAPTFTVASGHTETLEFGTCRFFYENLSAETLTYCWQDLVNSASAAGAVCFPPVQPVHTLATCTSLDGLFALGYVGLAALLFSVAADHLLLVSQCQPLVIITPLESPSTQTAHVMAPSSAV